MTEEEKQIVFVVILVNYHSGEDTIACIRSIREQETEHTYIVVVDNSQPNDASLNELPKNFSDLIVLPTSSNIGFGRANNLGIEWAQRNLHFDYLVLINNDTLIGPKAFSALKTPFQSKENIGMTTGKILYSDQTEKVWYGGATINRWKGWPEISDFNQVATPDGANKEREVEFVSGCLMMFSAESIKKLGGFDADFFMYCEDLELCLRIAESGYKMWYNPQCVIYHKVHGSSTHKGDTPKNLHVSNPNVSFLFYHLKTNQYRAIRRHYRIGEFLGFLFYFWARFKWFEMKMMTQGKFSFLATGLKTRIAILKIIFTEKRRKAQQNS